MSETGPAAAMSAPQRPAQMRVFFALWPDAASAAALQARGRELHAACGGRLMRRDTLHLTLAFVGEVPVARLGALEAVAESVRGERFALELDRVGSWHDHRIIWTGCAQVPLALQTLVQRLAAGLHAAGFTLEARAFKAHVTLVRKALRPPQRAETAPLRWQVASFVLVASEHDATSTHYRTLGRWPLRAHEQQTTIPRTGVWNRAG